MHTSIHHNEAILDLFYGKVSISVQFLNNSWSVVVILLVRNENQRTYRKFSHDYFLDLMKT